MYTEQNPLVSVLIPNYNYANYILGAIESACNQTYPNIEVIVYDDLSTDNSVRVIEDWILQYTGNRSVKLIKGTTNLGLGGACNLLLIHASGKYFQTLDADDIIYPEKIAEQVACFEKNGDAAIVFSDAEILNSEGLLTGEIYSKRINYHWDSMPQGKVFEKLYQFNFIPLPTVLVDTEMAREAGGFDDRYQVQDYCLWLKLSLKHTIIFFPKLVAGYRVHGKSMSKAVLTSAVSTEHLLNIKYAYYHESTSQIRDIFKRNLYNSLPTLVKYNPGKAYAWVKRNLVLNPGPKAVYYFLRVILGGNKKSNA